MNHDSEKSLQARPEQLIYASILEKGMLLGLLLVLVTYAIYVLGLIKPYVPTDEITKCWEMNVHDYLDHCHIHAGWAWVSLLGYGDFLNFAGIVLLAGVTLICFISIVPVLWRQNDKLYAVLALGEVIILGVAASGILGAGGH
ncbi:MAG: DUF1634 domain-containing protein [Desulfomonile tiedjei]|nr:DUF1634 domain-containing protein [Desulfomonile tiedjei]